MREILFRGKRAFNGEWITGSLVVDHSGYTYIVLEYEACRGIRASISSKTISVIPKTVGQYTGYQDKGGKKVFEGDIVWDNENDQLGIVEFDEGEFFVSFDGNIESGFADVINCCYVQGNIHDDYKMLGW